MRASLALVALALPAAAQDWFQAPRIYPEQDLGTIRLVSDMDADGDPDLLWLGELSMQVWFNDGTGEFVPGPLNVPAVPLALPDSNPRTYPAVGDVDADGEPDLVFALDVPYPDGIVVVFFGQGGGTFAPGHVIDLPDAPDPFFGNVSAMCLGDFDGDGAQEIASVHDTSTGFFVVDARSDLILWDWTGTEFAPTPPLVLDGDLAHVYSLAAADLDGDGSDDLAMAATNASIDPGRVQLVPVVGGRPTLGEAFPVTGTVIELVAGDAEGDGDLDVIAGHRWNCSSLDLSVVQNDGDGSFQLVDSGALPIDELSCTWWPHPLAGDWDGDGDLDVLHNFERFHVYENDGANGFSLASAVVSENENAFFDFGGGAADFDGDGWMDFASSRSILFGDGTPLANLEQPYPASGILPFQVRDWEGEGDLDLLNGNAQVATNDSTGTFALGGSLLPAASTPGNSFAPGTAVDDFDGDGYLDQLAGEFVSSGPFLLEFVQMTLLTGTPAGTFVEAGLAMDTDELIFGGPLGSPIRGMDADGDGDLDLPVAGGFWINDGTGYFDSFVPLFGSAAIVAGADLEGDGDLDLLTFLDAGATGTWSLQRNQGGLVFSAEPLVTGANLGIGARFLDLDDDGDLDVAVPSGDGTQAAVLFESAGGVLAPGVSLAGGVGSSDFVAATDVDGDGLTDLVVDRESDLLFGAANLQVHRRVGPGLVYEPARDWIAGDVFALFDVDQDGDDDAVGQLVVRNRRFEGPDAGSVRQYGEGSPGADGPAPVIGVAGTPVAGAAAEIRVRHALGGSFGVVLVSTGPSALPGVPFVGASTWIDLTGLFLYFALPFGGAPSVPGAGEATLPLTIGDALVGGTFYHQVWCFDPGLPSQIAVTQGLEVSYGAGG